MGVMTIAMLAMALNTGGEKGKQEEATFAAGCFWCVEAVFERVDGVVSVKAGYSGGSVPNPSYEQVCTGTTGHAESIRIVYDPSRVTYRQLLDIFWACHDPTTLNRQGADHGTQYRSVIFYNSAEQKAEAEASMTSAQKDFSDPIVTAIEPLKNFYSAENYHQDYYNKNPEAPYCQLVIAPKLRKLQKLHLK